MSAEIATVGSKATTTFRAEGSTLRRSKLGRDLPTLQGCGVAAACRTLPVGWQRTLLRASTSGRPAHCRQQPVGGRRKASQPQERSPLHYPALQSLWRPLLAKPTTAFIFSRLFIFSTLLHFFGFCSCLYYFLLFTFFGFILFFLSQILQVEF